MAQNRKESARSRLDALPEMLAAANIAVTPPEPLTEDQVAEVFALLQVPETERAAARLHIEAGRSLEVHLLDFEGDLYGRRLRVAFLARLRGEQKFDGLDALVAQIRADVEQGRRLLEEADPKLLEPV